jgi:hypothetical protein
VLDRPVFLVGMPRSGTTWLSQVFEAHPEVCVRLSPNYSYVLKDRLHVDSDAAAWTGVLGEAVASRDPFLTQDWRRTTGHLPRHPNGPAKRVVIKDTRFHALYQAGLRRLPQARCLYVVRHPCASLHSWRTSREFPETADFTAEWRSGACRKAEGAGEYWGFDDWCRVTRSYRRLQQEEPGRVRVFRYEDAVRDPAGVLADLFRFVGLHLHPAVTAFVDASRARHDPDPYSVFKDPARVVDRWRTALPAELIATVEAELHGTDLEEYLT